MTALPIIETQAGDVFRGYPYQCYFHYRWTDLSGNRVVPFRYHACSQSGYFCIQGRGQRTDQSHEEGCRYSEDLFYSQYRELQSFAQFGSDLDADTKARLDQGARIVEVLKQGRNAPVPVEKQVAVLYAVTKGILSRVAVEDVKEYEAGLFTSLDNDAEGVAVMQKIRSSGKLEGETEEELKKVLEQYTESFLDTKPATGK